MRRFFEFALSMSVTTVLLVGAPHSFAESSPITVDHVDLERYQGQWFEIASKPQPFQRGCECSEAHYEILKDGKVGVVNKCYRNGEWSQVEGIATVVDETSNAELRVRFGEAEPGDYLIIGLDSAYRYAVVASPAEDGLWILSRTPEMQPRLVGEAIETAASKVNLTELTFTEQSDCRREQSP